MRVSYSEGLGRTLGKLVYSGKLRSPPTNGFRCEQYRIPILEST